jgi:tetratricopeptide (TPR) repeat protein
MSDESFDQLVERARAVLGAYESVAEVWAANDAINEALLIKPESQQAWLLKSQIHSAMEDDLAALAAAEMAARYGSERAEVGLVRSAVLADLGHFEAAIELLDAALRQLKPAEHWLLEDLYYEKAAALDACEQSEEALATLEQGLRLCPDSELLRAGLEPLKRQRVRSALRLLDGGRR